MKNKSNKKVVYLRRVKIQDLLSLMLYTVVEAPGGKQEVVV